MQKKSCLFIVLLLPLIFFISSCTPLVVGTTATAFLVSSMQERSVGSIIDDKTLYMKVRNALIHNKTFKDIRLSISEGRVLLTGSVKNSMDKIKATKIVWEQIGVREVMNEIVVNEKDRSFAKSAWITSQIKARLLIRSSIRSFNYSVETYDGVVYLLGIARNKSELNSVMSIARRIDGVKQVVSYIRLKNSNLRFK